MAQASIVSGQVQEAWVSRYNNTNNGAYALAADDVGNVYMAGFAPSTNASSTRFPNTDILTVKYDVDGNQVWEARFEGYRTNACEAYGIGVDGAGNVCVTGVVRAGGNNYSDIATIKYDPNGQQLWAAYYAGPWLDEPYALTIDQQGNIVVTGDSYSFDNLYDVVTIKYDPDGHELWAKLYNGPFGRDDYGEALALDAQGNILVHGTSNRSGDSSSDLLTLKYNPSGELLWAARYSGQGNRQSAGGIGVDAAGNVYVAGSSRRSLSVASIDIVTVKYSAAGEELWTASYNGPANDFDAVRAVAVTAGGEVYVAGFSSGVAATHDDYVTIKYDTNGRQLWASRYDGPGNGWDQVRALALDATGNAYVTGYSYGTNASQTEYATIKYDSLGNLRWEARYGGFSNGSAPTAIRVNATGNVYVTGNSSGAAATVKYVQSDVPGIPRITFQPASITTLPDGPVVFEVEASGVGELQYQWSFNCRPLAGETNATLQITAAQSPQAGDYAVEVRNSSGRTRSPDARLTFTSQLQELSFDVGTGVAFTLLGETGVVYQVQGSTNLLSWISLTNLVNSSGSVRHTNSTAGEGQYFYRAVKVQ